MVSHKGQRAAGYHLAWPWTWMILAAVFSHGPPGTGHFYLAPVGDRKPRPLPPELRWMAKTPSPLPKFRLFCEPTLEVTEPHYVCLPQSRMARKAAHGWGSTHLHCLCVVGVFIPFLCPSGPGCECLEDRRECVPGALMSIQNTCDLQLGSRAEAEEGQELSREERGPARLLGECGLFRAAL